MPKKDKDKKGPSTQPTSTNGVNAVGTNHGTKQGYVAYSTYSPDAAPVPGKKFNVSGVPGATIPPAAFAGQQQQAQQAGPVQVQPQTDTNVQQNTVAQPVQTAPAGNVVQVAPQQIVLPNQITMPSGRVINMQPQQQPVQQAGGTPQQVTIGNNTYQMPTQTGTNASDQQPKEPTAAQQNAEYEAQKQQEAARQQYNNAVDEYLKAGGNPNVIRSHEDPNIERMQPTAEQVQQAQANAQQPAQTDEDEYVKTLKEYLDSKYESPEDREQREKREARQRRWAAISEGLANVFNVGGSIAGAIPAQLKSTVGELYANQEAESDKHRAEYREALRDMITYRNAIRNGDIARARAIEERRKNDFYERKMLEDIASKQANDELKKQKQEADEKRKDQEAKNKQRAADDKHEEHVDKKARGYTTARSSSGGGKGRGRSGGSKSTGAAAAKSAKAAAKRRAKAATQGTKFGKK